MPPIKRRQFLQFTGSSITALGLSQLDIQRQSERYGQVLAQSTPRKLALLVGINEYDPNRKWTPLNGCITDIDLQQKLLTHRFGFNSKDILRLENQAATRESILQAFEEHLIKQVKPGDVVVFHYSGHGSQVVDPDRDFPDGRNSTLVPINSPLPLGYPNKGGSVKDITGHTLFLLMAALDTENVTVVLDSCYSGGGVRGNLIVRSRQGDAELKRLQGSNIQLEASPAEKEYQQQWLSRLNFSPSEFIERRTKGIAKGVTIASAKRDQFAADAPFTDTHAGVFTYELTRYLWQQTGNESVGKVIVITALNTKKVNQDLFPKSPNVQEPELASKPDSNNDKQSVYFSDRQGPPAEAVVTKVEDSQIEVLLGGVDPRSLEAFGRGATLTLVDAQGREQGLVQLDSRQKLTGRGRLLKAENRGAIQPGVLLQERVRGIPSDLTLRIGLDPSLGRDTDEAKRALQSIKRIEALPLQQREVQYIFGRMTDGYRQVLSQRSEAILPAVGSFGLFSPGLELIPDSFGAAEETVMAAVNRLQTKLKSLLATRIVKLTLNTNSSRLNMAASMQLVGGGEIIASSFTVRGSSGREGGPDRTTPVNPPNSRQLPLKTQVQFQIQNNETRELYVSVLLLSPDGEMTVLFPNDLVAAEDTALVQAGQTLRIPEIGRDRFKLTIGKPTGVVEVLIIASSTPMRNALKVLQAAASRRGLHRGDAVPLDEEPAEVIGSLLNDLDEGTRGSDIKPVAGIRRIDTTQMAAMSITFEVIDAPHS